MVLLIIVCCFEVVYLLAEAVEALFDGSFGGGEGLSNFTDREMFESEVDERAFVGFEGGEEAVVVGRHSGLRVGDGVVHPVLEGHETGLLGMAANLGDGDIDGDAAYPGVGATVASEAWPGLPKVAGDFLVEVAYGVRGLVGEVEADLEDGVSAAVKHIKELSVVVVAERIKP